MMTRHKGSKKEPLMPSVRREQAAARGRNSASLRRKWAGMADTSFAPPRTTLKTFLVQGSDRRFRELFYKVLGTSTLLLRVRDQFAEKMGVSGPQYSMVIVIGEAGRATVCQIAKQLHVSSQFVTVEVGKLIARNTVVRKPNKVDRRSRLWH
jgi:hypothetical protein